MGVWRCGNKGKPGATPCILPNTFDCQFSRYNPRLDAIMYYNMINGVAVKRFVDEVRHANGVQSYLFRDETGDCLHVLWKEGARVDCGVPLPGVETARLIRIDGGEVAIYNEHIYPVLDNGRCRQNVTGIPDDEALARKHVQVFAEQCY